MPKHRLPKPVIEVIETPGLSDLAEANLPAGPDLAAAVASLIRSPGIETSGLAVEMGLLVPGPAGGAIDLRGITSSALVRGIKNVFANRREEIVGSQRIRLPVAVYWIDVPPVPGAKAKLTVETEKRFGTAAKVKVVGIGGGGGGTITLKSTVDYETAVSAIMKLSVPATALKIQVFKGRTVEATFGRVVQIKWKQTTWEPSDAPNSTGVFDDTVAPEFRFEGRHGSGTLTPTPSIARGKDWELSGGFTVPQLNLNLEVNASGKYTKTVKYAYTLPPGHLYEGWRLDDRPGFSWKLDRNQ